MMKFHSCVNYFIGLHIPVAINKSKVHMPKAGDEEDEGGAAKTSLKQKEFDTNLKDIGNNLQASYL